MIKTFWLVLGYACNNRCTHCYASPAGFSHSRMNLTYAQNVMTVMEKAGTETCLLIGGEPTLYPNLGDLIHIGHQMGLKMIIVSNGRRLKNSQFTNGLFKKGLERAVVSLEGADEKTHNEITGRKSFHETVRGIRVCSESGTVNTLTTICRQNSHQILEIIRLAYQIGARKAVLNCAIPIVGPDGVIGDYALDPLELATTIEAVFKTLSKEGAPFQLNATFPLCLLSEETLRKALEFDWISVGCHMYRGKGVVFDPQGNILPCTHFSEAPLIENTMSDNGGFRLKDSFWEIWNDQNSPAGEFRQALWRYPAQKCVDCDYWGACVGGCPLLWTHFDPQQFIDKREVRSA